MLILPNSMLESLAFLASGLSLIVKLLIISDENSSSIGSRPASMYAFGILRSCYVSFKLLID